MRKKNLFESFCRFIVEKRLLFFFVFLAIKVFEVFMIPKTVVNDDISTFLPAKSETKQALDIMESEFKTMTSIDIMVKNISKEDALLLQATLNKASGISIATFNAATNYKDNCALYSLMLKDDANYNDTASSVEGALAGNEYCSVALSSSRGGVLMKEMLTILLITVAVIIVVLLFTSKSFLEIPVFLIVFFVAGILNMGTNFIFPSVSFVTNAIAVVLQLALAVDYAIIFGHRYIDERKNLPAKEAVIKALMNAIKEILSSSLTTLAGLVALTLMTLQIGRDMGFVLGKGIIVSCLTVFFLMPGLILLFSKAIDKTMHRNFVPSVRGMTKTILKGRYIVAGLFICIFATCGVVQSFNTYSYNYSAVPNAAQAEIEEVFGKNEMIGLLLHNTSYESQAKIIETLKKDENVVSVNGLAAVELGGIKLTQKMKPAQLAMLLPTIDYEQIKQLYGAYALANFNLSGATNVENYSVPLIDIVVFAIEADPELSQNEMFSGLLAARKMLSSNGYDRILINLSVSGDFEKDFVVMDKLDVVAKNVSKSSLLFGNYAVVKDLSRGFMHDVVVVSVLTCAFILVILLLAFRSISIPLILILVIQGSIFINFSIPVMLGNSVFFMSYIIVSAIQMGATIDYAIVITNRYMKNKQGGLKSRDAIAEAMNSSFPSVITSGLMLTVAGFLVGTISSHAIVSSIGSFLGQGALISLLVVLFVLPQLLVILDKFIQKTTLKRRKVNEREIDPQEPLQGSLQDTATQPGENL